MSETRAATASNWNVPNALTTLRILMVPFYGWALLTHDGESNGWRWVAYAIFVVAMVTDKIDGDLARKHDLVTNFGKIADPIADKALTGMGFIGLTIIGALGPFGWWITAIVLIREWGVTIARLSIAKHVVLAANRSGKLKTFAQALALGGLSAPFHQLHGGWNLPGDVVWVASVAMLVVAVVLTVTSGYEFARDAVTQRRAARPVV
jgi:CDP-diacylglycerol--glycerol-3-phosphate 3-phosphatidyltransferase